MSLFCSILVPEFKHFLKTLQNLSMWKDILKVGFWMIYINTTKLSHRFHTVKPIHFVFFSSKFTRLNQCVRWQFRNHEVFLIYTRFLRGKTLFSRKYFLCVSKQYRLNKKCIFFKKTQKNQIFFKKVPGVYVRLKKTWNGFRFFHVFGKHTW